MEKHATFVMQHNAFSTVDTTDYGELDMILQFDICDVRQCTFASIVNDLVDEPEELFIYTLERTPGLDDRIDLDPTVGKIVITDDDSKEVRNYYTFSSRLFFYIAGITVGYEFEVYNITETIGTVQICAVMYNPPSGGAPQGFVVSSTTRDGSACRKIFVLH